MSFRLLTDTHNLPKYNISIYLWERYSHLKIWTSYIVSIRLWKGKFWLIALTRFLCMKNVLVHLGCPFLIHIIYWYYEGHCFCLWGDESISCYIELARLFLKNFFSRWHYRTNNAKHHFLQRGSALLPRKTRTSQSKCICPEWKKNISSN